MSFNLPSLNRLAAVDQVAAAYIFNYEGIILGREVPLQYSDDTLIRISDRLKQVLALVESHKLGVKEFRLTYENFGVWVRLFGERYILVIFLEAKAQMQLIRQPVNLAVLNLEKALRAAEERDFEKAQQNPLAESALRAERAIFQSSGSDTNQFLSRLGVIATYFHGPIGPEVIEHACRALMLDLPIAATENMRKVLTGAGEEIPNPEKKASFILLGEDLIQRIELEIASAEKRK